MRGRAAPDRAGIGRRIRHSYGGGALGAKGVCRSGHGNLRGGCRGCGGENVRRKTVRGRAYPQGGGQPIALVAGGQGLAQQLQRALLADGPVAGAALGRMHARRAAVLARAGGHGFAGGFQQLPRIGKGLAGETGAAGQTIVNKHRGQAQLRVQGRGYAAEIVAVRHDQQGQQTNSRVFQGVDGTHKVQKALFQIRAQHVGKDIPEALSFKNLRWRVQGYDGQQPVA